MAMPTSGTLIAVNNGVSKYATNVPGFFETTGWEVQSTYLDSFGHLWVMAANHPDEDSGDLTLGRCDYSGGAWHKVGEGMQMKGFGHGLSFGIEIAGTDFYVWSECDTSGAGRGKAIAKYLYQDDVVIFNDDVTPMYPFGEGMVTDCSCTVQFGSVPVFVMRCAYFGFHFYQAWNLADAINNTWTSPYLSQGFGNLGQIEPTLVDSGGDALIMQGWTFEGRWLYITTDLDSTKAPYLWSVDLDGTMNNSDNYHARSSAKNDGGSGVPESAMIDSSGSFPVLVYGRLWEKDLGINLWKIVN